MSEQRMPQEWQTRVGELKVIFCGIKDEAAALLVQRETIRTRKGKPARKKAAWRRSNDALRSLVVRAKLANQTYATLTGQWIAAQAPACADWTSLRQVVEAVANKLDTLRKQKLEG